MLRVIQSPQMIILDLRGAAAVDRTGPERPVFDGLRRIVPAARAADDDQARVLAMLERAHAVATTLTAGL